MKKALALFLCVVCIFSLSACGEGKRAQELYDAIGSISFSDDSILTSDEFTQIERMRAQKEQLFKDTDIDGLASLQKEWSAFRQPIDGFIKQYQTACGTFFSETEKAFLTTDELETCQTMEGVISEAYQSRDSGALTNSIAEWDSYSSSLRDVINTYTEIDQSPFSKKELGLLSSETKTKMEDLSKRTETALVDRDAAALKSLKSEWYSFTSNGKSEIETATEQLLNDWVSGANVTDTLTNLFSFGSITSTTTISGHIITYSSQYNFDVDASELKRAMESYLNWTSSVFEGGAKSLKTYIDDVCIRVEYKDKNGNVVCYKEFK